MSDATEKRVGGIDESRIGQRYNVIVVFCSVLNRVIVQEKMKGPYPDCLNFPGGKCNEGEDPTAAAYRELEEETGLTPEDLMPLKWLTTETFPIKDSDKLTVLDVFYTRLKAGQSMNKIKRTTDVGDKQWWEQKSNLRHVDDRGLAGDGNIPYLLYFAELKLREDMGLALKQSNPGYVGTI